MHALRHSFSEAVVLRAGEHVVSHEQQKELAIAWQNTEAINVVQQSFM